MNKHTFHTVVVRTDGSFYVIEDTNSKTPPPKADLFGEVDHTYVVRDRRGPLR